MRVLEWLKQPPRTRLIGVGVVLIGAFIVINQLRIVVQKKHALPDIRHTVLWTKNLYQQAHRSRSEPVAAELASFYLIERELKGAELIVEPRFEAYRWNLEEVSRTRVTVDPSIRPVRAEAWADLTRDVPRTGKLEKHTLYVFPERSATYVLVSTTDDKSYFLVPEAVYRARAVASSGANLSAP